MKTNDTICAVSTAPGIGGIAVVRICGENAKSLCAKMLRGRVGQEMSLKPNTATVCQFFDGQQLVDDVVATYFAAPHSYTGDHIVELSCHGSLYVQKKIMETLLKNGARLAEPGEFTQRAFLGGKLDLMQAEAVADLIDSKSEAAHRMAVNQLRGGFSKKLSQLRQQLVELASLIELELDFSDEDVEFADRSNFKTLVQSIQNEVSDLAGSFRVGAAIKNGVPVAIVGKPNVGKSTLLNALLGDDRAIVSDMPGTTRDTVEDTTVFDGIEFRFIDTAGIRNSNDAIERHGIERSFAAAQKAMVVLYVADASQTSPQALLHELDDFRRQIDSRDKHIIVVVNKMDLAQSFDLPGCELPIVRISARNADHISSLVGEITQFFKDGVQADTTVLTNLRHYEAMCKILESLKPVREGLDNGTPGDLLMVDIRQALYYIGLITGQVASDEILGTIFSRFCIGK